MSHGHHHKSRYARLVSAFAASAFALLITLTSQQFSANAASGEAVTGALTMTNYRPMTKCPYKPTDRGYRTLIKACTTRSIIQAQ